VSPIALQMCITDDTPEALLVDSARHGDAAAFGRLYTLYSRMVHGILLARVPRSEVDDLAQDVFLLAMRKLHTLRDSAAFGSWLAMVTRNRAIDYYRHKADTDELPENLACQAGSQPAGPQMEAAAILALIQSLPEAYRETLVLRLVEGMTGPEIASRTGLTHASVRVNLHRGMKQLREKIGAAV